MENHIGEYPLPPPKMRGGGRQVNHRFQAAFHLRWLLAGGLGPILDQAPRPNLPLRLLYGSKLKWLCARLLSKLHLGFTTTLNFLSQVGRKKLPLFWLTMLSWSKWSSWSDVHLFSVGSTPPPHLRINRPGNASKYVSVLNSGYISINIYDAWNVALILRGDLFMNMLF